MSDATAIVVQSVLVRRREAAGAGGAPAYSATLFFSPTPHHWWKWEFLLGLQGGGRRTEWIGRSRATVECEGPDLGAIWAAVAMANEAWRADMHAALSHERDVAALRLGLPESVEFVAMLPPDAARGAERRRPAATAKREPTNAPPNRGAVIR